MHAQPLLAISNMATEMLDAASHGNWESVEQLQRSIADQLEKESPVDLCKRYPQLKTSIVSQTQRILEINFSVENLIKSHLQSLNALSTINTVEQKLNKTYSSAVFDK